MSEVLITLGIIGVVAAMTMPALTAKYREETTMTKLKKFYTTMSQVQLRAIADHGEVDTWDWIKDGEESNNEIILNWYNKYFGQYISSAKVIDRKILNDDELVDGGITVQMADGTVFNMSSFAGGYLHFVYYTNYKTFMDETAQQGKDAFMFGFSTYAKDIAHSHPCLKRFNAYGCHYPDNTLKNGWQGCYTQTTEHAFCSALLQRNGWHVPKDYPFKF